MREVMPRSRFFQTNANIDFDISIIDNYNYIEVIDRIINEEAISETKNVGLYVLSWLFALMKAIGAPQEKLYNILKGAVFSLLSNKKVFKYALYERESAAGIMFALSHLLEYEYKTYEEYSRIVLDKIRELRWHDFDGEILAFSFILSNSLGDTNYVSVIRNEINENMEKWIRILDYDSLRNIIYVSFGYAYREHKDLIDIVGKTGIYDSKSRIITELINTGDAELIALLLYVLGKLVYSKRLSKELSKDKHEDLSFRIRHDVIPDIGRSLISIIRESGFLNKDNLESVPQDFYIKIKLALIESGLDKPFMLSKYEWEIYNEVKNWVREGYHAVYKRDLLITIVVDTVAPLFIIKGLPLIATTLNELFSNVLNVTVSESSIFYTLLAVLVNLIGGMNLSIWKNGTIEKKYLSGILKYIADFLGKLGKAKGEEK